MRKIVPVTIFIMKKIFIFIIIVIIAVGVSHAFMFSKKASKDPVYLTLDQLSQFDGKNGRPMYVAVDGAIYDLTKCRYWKDGVHAESPQEAVAGRDLTDVLKKSKHGMKRVKRFPLVGYVVDSPTNS